MSGLNFFDKMFDFNHDGKLGATEQAAKWGTIAHMMDQSSKAGASSNTHAAYSARTHHSGLDEDDMQFASELSITHGFSGTYHSGLDDMQQQDLELAGLDVDELECMDEEERREVLEDAGLDPDDYDFD